MERARSESGYYHVCHRGNGQQLIFEDDDDRRRLQGYLAAFRTRGVDVVAWCLMENHIHLVLHDREDALSACMHYLSSGYAHYFNLRHGRKGHLFEGRYLSEPIENDEYLLQVVRYVHYNPVKAGNVLDEYHWSSYDEYVNPQVEAIAYRDLVWELLGGVEGFVRFHACYDGAPLSAGETVRNVCDVLERARAIVAPFGIDDLSMVKAQSKETRNAIMRALREGGISAKEIVRLTGVSIATIYRILK